ncbi:MAG: methylmalonyl-CoA carboxyltransferase, partial [Actinobacteria bacterium]|nr:methylmalonyl-CoA carboxyltransferase [Actinomycetota bacterium]
MKERLEELAERKEAALHAGSERAVERHHAKGKMTARERIEYLLDEGSFQELDMLARHRAHDALEDRPYTDGVITGFGTVDGRRVCVFSQDFTVFGGALGEVFAEKIHKVMDLASSLGVPMIGLNDGAGARIQEGVVSLDSYGKIFHRNVLASGVIPQISVIMGPCAGGAVYSPA